MFDLLFYGNFYLDLQKLGMNDEELEKHYHTNGKNEGMWCCEEDFYKEYPTFDLEFYNYYYDDLFIFANGNKYALLRHYHTNGKNEGRWVCEEDFYKEYPTFDLEFYNHYNADLYKIFGGNKYALMRHYHYYGKNEGKLCSEKDFYNVYPDFDLEFYNNFYPDLSIFQGDKYALMNHYHFYGKNEGRVCNFNSMLKNNKENFREFCLENMNYMRNIYLPDFCENIYETVLIEYRCLPHLEFLIRNTIIKLGTKWSHTIICGNLNYDYMVSMCSTISNKIKIIKTNYDNLFPSEYSNFLASLNFWNLLNGEKILIYQEDTIIFKNNIDDFLKWDYIGAPWPEHQNDNTYGVGNGGFSLRSKSIMIKIIETVSIHNTIYNSCTQDYIKNTNSTVPPEDVYFTKNMLDYNIGHLADRNSAFKFSTESIVNKNSFGGHQFWLNDTEWKNRIYENIIFLAFNYDTENFEHENLYHIKLDYNKTDSFEESKNDFQDKLNKYITDKFVHC